MAYTRTTVIDSGPSGDSVKQAVLDLDTDLTGAFSGLNDLDSKKIAKTTATAKGDLLVGTAAGTVGVVAVGTLGQVLTTVAGGTWAAQDAPASFTAISAELFS
jgi:hypothetical protein